MCAEKVVILIKYVKLIKIEIDILIKSFLCWLTSLLTGDVDERKLAQAAECQFSRDHLVPVVENIAHCWTQFAVRLHSGKLTSSAISLIRKSNQEPFDQAYKMMEDWRNKWNKAATCHLVITTFLNMDMKLQACEVFGEALVEYVNKVYGSLV